VVLRSSDPAIQRPIIKMKKYFRTEVEETDIYQIPYRPGIKLDQNESPWDIPIELKVAITEKLIKADWNRYPLTEDYKPILRKLAKEHDVLLEQFVLSNGTNTIVQALISMIPHNSKVLILDPSFSHYENQIQLQGRKLVKVPLSEDFELLPERTITAIKKEKPALILIANPNAPTGTLFDKKSLYRIIQMANCPVVIDEAFFYFTAETAMDWLNDFSNLIILRSFSRAAALAGVRFGYAVTDSDIAHTIEKCLTPFRLSKISCLIIEEILNHPKYIQEHAQSIIKERGRLFSKLQTIDGVQVFPSEANFLLLRMDKAKEVTKKLFEDEKVVIRDVSNDTTLENCLRVTVGTPAENDMLLMALKRVKNDLKDN